MSNVIGIIGALAVGVAAGVIVKKNAGNSESKAKDSEIERLAQENNNLSEAKKKLSRQVEDLYADLKKARTSMQDSEDAKDDMEDDLTKARIELKKVERLNEELAQSLKEYKNACEAQEAEIKSLKEKLNRV